jgi:hypothetical protein
VESVVAYSKVFSADCERLGRNTSDVRVAHIRVTFAQLIARRQARANLIRVILAKRRLATASAETYCASAPSFCGGQISESKMPQYGADPLAPTRVSVTHAKAHRDSDCLASTERYLTLARADAVLRPGDHQLQGLVRIWETLAHYVRRRAIQPFRTKTNNCIKGLSKITQ